MTFDRFHATLQMVIIAAALSPSFWSFAIAQSNDPAQGVQLLRQQAESLKPLVKSDVGKAFLAATNGLPTIGEREIFVHRQESRRAISATAAQQLDIQLDEEFASRKLDEHFYYFTRYGSPLAFVRPLEIASAAGLDELRGKRIVDFGFGSIGHLRLMASQGADVSGIEVDQWLKALYCHASDVGEIPYHREANGGDSTLSGTLELMFGSFPSELGNLLRGDVDWFISKNTLKRGYIHPEQPVDPKKLVHLGVTDAQFLAGVHHKLKKGGHFLIYNLHPSQAPNGKPYIPWADGRSPFDRQSFEESGFQVLAFDVDDSITIRSLAKALKWNEQMDLETDLFATYTLARKK